MMTSVWDTDPLAVPRKGRVTLSLLEEGLERARQVSPGPDYGVFGPQSAIWRRQREALVFFGAGRAMVLQTAHPWVAAGVAQMSDAMNRPLARFHRTFIIVFSLVFGSLDQAFEKARLVHHIHSRIEGVMSETVGPFKKGSAFAANDIEAMLWVHATLWDSSIFMHELICGPMSVAEKEEYYEETKRFAWLFGLPGEALPPTWGHFQAYVNAMLASNVLSAGTEGRLVVDSLLRGSGERPRPKVPFWFYALTVDSLPERIRGAFDMPLGERERRVAERWQKRLQVWYPRLPRAVRFVPPYHEAQRRIAGRQGPGLLTGALNRLWVGRSRLVSLE